MRKKYNTAATFAPPRPGEPQTIRIPEPEPRDRRPVITHASNQSVPLPIGLLLLIVYLALAFLIAYFGGEWAGAPMPIRMVFGGVLATSMAFATMAFITGDAMGMWESLHVERTERKWADVESERIDATMQVALARTDVEIEKERTEQLRIETDATVNRLHVRLADIERKLLADGASPGPDRTDKYVSNHADPAQVAVRDFVASCYDAHGFNAEMLYSNGGIRGKAPWNGIWAAEPWREDAEHIMRTYVLDDDKHQPHFRHATDAAAQAAIPIAQ